MAGCHCRPQGFKRSRCEHPEETERKRTVVSLTTADLIEESRRARLEGRAVLFRTLDGDAIRALRAHKDPRVRKLCVTVESHLD